MEAEISSLKGRREMKRHPRSGTKPHLGCGVRLVRLQCLIPRRTGGQGGIGGLRSDGRSLRGRENKSSVSEKCILSEGDSSSCAQAVCLFHFIFGSKLQEQHGMSLPALCHLP